MEFLQNSDFRAFVGLLNKHRVKFLLVGGYAVGFHGHPRYTGDLDIWINNDPETANYMVNVMKEFGFESLDLKAGDFQAPGYVIQIGRPPFRIDILTSADGVRFEDCFPHRQIVRFEQDEIPFISLENLIVNKKATGRAQDLSDIASLTHPKNNPSRPL